MAYEQTLALRVRKCLPGDVDVEEMKMFGGLAFLSRGNMGLAVVEDGLMIRVPRDEYDRTLNEYHVRHVEMGGRTMRGFVLIDSLGLETDEDLTRWVERGIGFAASLPPK